MPHRANSFVENAKLSQLDFTTATLDYSSRTASMALAQAARLAVDDQLEMPTGRGRVRNWHFGKVPANDVEPLKILGESIASLVLRPVEQRMREFAATMALYGQNPDDPFISDPVARLALLNATQVNWQTAEIQPLNFPSRGLVRLNSQSYARFSTFSFGNVCFCPYVAFHPAQERVGNYRMAVEVEAVHFGGRLPSAGVWTILSPREQQIAIIPVFAKEARESLIHNCAHLVTDRRTHPRSFLLEDAKRQVFEKLTDLRFPPAPTGELNQQQRQERGSYEATRDEERERLVDAAIGLQKEFIRPKHNPRDQGVTDYMRNVQSRGRHSWEVTVFAADELRIAPSRCSVSRYSPSVIQTYLSHETSGFLRSRLVRESEAHVSPVWMRVARELPEDPPDEPQASS